jgi:hypothetical protein
MVMRLSSQPIASDGVQHGCGEKAKADGYEQNIEHGNLTFRRNRACGLGFGA